jgi:galactose mutarotase-like enzyme
MPRPLCRYGAPMISLESGGATAAVAPLGAELRRWSIGGHDLLWPGDPAWWPQSAPVLFPIVGWARNGVIRVGGIERPMGVHGFAAASTFAVEHAGPDEALLVLRESEATLAAYPFPFRLALTYRLAPDSLSVAVAVENGGDRPMPYAVGLHPGFRWPLAAAGREDHAVVLDADEAGEVPVIAPGGLFSARRRPVPLGGRRLALNDDLFAAEALCFLDARSRGLTYEAGPGGPSIRLAADGFPHWAIWSKPGAPFVSIEAWTGHGDPEGFSGDLADKPSMRLLAPGETERATLTMTWTA